MRAPGPCPPDIGGCFNRQTTIRPKIYVHSELGADNHVRTGHIDNHIRVGKARWPILNTARPPRA